MLLRDANDVVESLRRERQLYLPALSKRRGFSSSRVEHLLNRLVQRMPQNECYLEIGVLEGRTLEAASIGNDGKTLVGVDPCEKYDFVPDGFGPNVLFVQARWQDLKTPLLPVGVCFYDGDHSTEQTRDFMLWLPQFAAGECVLVLDDWDRESVRDGAFEAAFHDPDWVLVRECPEYGDGLTCPQSHFGYSFGVSVWGWQA